MSIWSELGLGLKPEQVQLAVKYLDENMDRDTKLQLSQERKLCPQGEDWWIKGFHHFGTGMWIRNILREIIKDNEVFGNWDDHYMDILTAVLDNFDEQEYTNNFVFNMDNNLRMNIITNEDWDWDNLPSHAGQELSMYGGVLNFEIEQDTLNELIKNDFVNLYDTQNCAPSIREFIAFCDKYPNENFEFIGYAVLPPREDYRISIEGLICYTTNRDLVIEFMKRFKDADELSYTDDELRCWYD